MVKVVIVGGGALGSAAAFRLAEAGCEVVVVDAAAAPNASQVAAGMLAPAMESALDATAAPHSELLRRARAAWPAFALKAGVVLSEQGAWAVGSAGFIEGVSGRLADTGFRVGSRDLAAARIAVPGLSESVKAAVFAPDDALLEPMAALAALKAGAQARGGRWVVGRALEVRPHHLRTTAGDIRYDRLIIATGAGMGLVPDTERLEPIKGHILTAGGFAYAGPVLRGEGVYVAPAAKGVRIGASMERASDLEVAKSKADDLQASAGRLLPALATASAEAQAGVRAATPSGLPWVGPASDGSTLLAVGARRNGWLLAPLAAEALTSYVLGGAAPNGSERMASDLFSPDPDSADPENGLSHIFFAIRPPTELALEIHRFAEAERRDLGMDGRVLSPDRLHMTAVPVGAYSPEIVHHTLRVAERVSAPAFDIVLDRVGSYPRSQGGAPYVLTPAVSTGFAAMQTAILSAQRGGLTPKGKRYSPHMTLLYDRQEAPTRAIAPFRWRVREFVLIQSLVGQAAHRELGRWSLTD